MYKIFINSTLISVDYRRIYFLNLLYMETKLKTIKNIKKDKETSFYMIIDKK